MKAKKTIKFAEQARRDNEIEMYGKLLSLRPSIVHKSKKAYNRQEYKRFGLD